MEIDLKELAQKVNETYRGAGEFGDSHAYAAVMCAIMTADCVARQAAAAEQQATHLATIAGALNIMLDLITDFVTDGPMVDDGATEYCAACDRPLLDDDAHIGEDGEKFHPDCCPECEHQAVSSAPEMGTDL